jgi:hypothetical protein
MTDMDFRANIAALYAAKHPWALTELALASRTDLGGSDFGQHAVNAWAMTGDQKYLPTAAAKLLKALTIDPLPNANTVRELFAELAMLYGWIRPLLTAEQNAEFETRLNRWCEFCFAINTPKNVGGWRYGDTDQTLGQYLGLLICDQIFGWEWTKRPEAVLAREAMREYVAKSAGGEWLESGGYNLGTLQILLIGVYAAGIELFPEIPPLLPEIVEQSLVVMTPDLKSAYQWGDEEEPRGLHWPRRVVLFSLLIGLTGDRRLQALLDYLVAHPPWPIYFHLCGRALYLYQPAPAAPPPATALRVTQGNGQFFYKRGTALLGVHFPKRLKVDHEVNYTADLQLYLDGEWVLTRTIGYSGFASRGDAGNSPLFAGLSSMADRGPIAWKETPEGCEISGGTRGQFYLLPYWNPPPAFVEHSRKIVYAYPGKLTVTDSFQGNKPTALARYLAADQAIINTSPLWQQVWHCPVQPTATEAGFTWKTAGGKTVALTAPAGCSRLVVDETAKWGMYPGQFNKSELKWQIRFASDEPTCEMTTVFEVK